MSSVCHPQELGKDSYMWVNERCSQQRLAHFPDLELWSNEDLPTVEEAQVVFKQTRHAQTFGSNGKHPGVLRELPDVIERLLLIIFVHWGSWRLEENKCHWHLQGGQERGLQGTAGWSVSPWSLDSIHEGDGTNYAENCSWTTLKTSDLE